MEATEQIINPGKLEVQSLELDDLSSKHLKVDILRLDKIHPVISGNKWFKLKYYLKDALENRFDTIITFGGAWSNHIVAAAYAAGLSGLKSIGVIRGEVPAALSKTLKDASKYGMMMEFIDREAYSHKNDEDFRARLSKKYGRAYFIPEGGAGTTGIEGCKEILNLNGSDKYSHIIGAIGTSTMFKGLLQSSLAHQEIIGIPVLKGIVLDDNEFFTSGINRKRWNIIYDYHFGGYAKKTPPLIKFMNDFYVQTGIPTDFVYTGKVMYSLLDLITKDYFAAGSNILAIHSGGLQGNASLPMGMLLF